MKNVFPALFALFVLAACNPRDTDRRGPTEFTYNNTTYEVPNGYLIDFGANGNATYDWDLYLTSESISKGGFFGLTGTGDYIYLDLNVSNPDGLLAGTYNWSATRDDFSVVVGTTALDYNLGTFEGTAIDAVDGTVDISILGITTTITFTLTLADGNTVSGTWSGTLDHV